MLGTILEISGSSVIIKLSIDINVQPNLIGLHVVFEDADHKENNIILNFIEFILLFFIYLPE